MNQTTDPKEGIFDNIPNEEYRAAPGICQSDLKLVPTSPRHYLTKVSSPPEPSSEAQIIGIHTHRLVFEGRRDYVVKPDGMKFTTKAGMEWRDAQTKPIISSKDSKNLDGMYASIHSHPIAKRILSYPGNNEVSCWKRHESTGLLLKGRADRIVTDNQNMMVLPDLKTCPYGEGCMEDFSRAIFKWGYHRQAAFYLDLFGATFFVFIVVEKEPPFAVATYNLSPESITLGRKENERDLRIIKQCMDSGEWPAYGESMSTINVPDWALRKEL